MANFEKPFLSYKSLTLDKAIKITAKLILDTGFRIVRHITLYIKSQNKNINN